MGLRQKDGLPWSILGRYFERSAAVGERRRSAAAAASARHIWPGGGRAHAKTPEHPVIPLPAGKTLTFSAEWRSKVTGELRAWILTIGAEILRPVGLADL